MLKQAVRSLVTKFGYEINKVSDFSEPVVFPLTDILELIVKKHLEQSPDFFFVQIGAADGSFADPVCKLIKQYHLRGVLVEPQPRVFQKLVSNYSGEEQLAFENVVIGTSDGTTKFYSVKESACNLSNWLEQSASLNRDKVLGALHYWKQKHPDSLETADSLLEETTLPTLTIKSLLQKYGVQKLDLLVIDTMSFDFEIIKMFPFDWIKPSIIHFEHSLLSIQDQRACLKYLADLGYSLTKVAVDTIACLNMPTRYWGVKNW
jgi:FkbM family methyltransferase